MPNFGAHLPHEGGRNQRKKSEEVKFRHRTIQKLQKQGRISFPFQMKNKITFSFFLGGGGIFG